MTSTQGRIVIPRGLTRARYAAILLGAAAAIGLFLLWSLTIWHGVGAWIVLGLAALALTLVGGPAHRARRLEFSPDEIVIRRFTTITTRIPTTALAEVTVREDPRVELVLEPVDPVAFFTAHRELRATRVGSTTRIPAGRDLETARDLRGALALLPLRRV